jgi:hypothetical protein
MSRQTDKTLNWPDHDKALKCRESLTNWFLSDIARAAKSTSMRERQSVYIDAAMQTRLSMKELFGMALRQTTGFLESLPWLIGLG